MVAFTCMTSLVLKACVQKKDDPDAFQIAHDGPGSLCDYSKERDLFSQALGAPGAAWKVHRPAGFPRQFESRTRYGRVIQL